MDDIRKLVEDKKAVKGTKETLKLLRQGKIAKVLVSSNVPAEVLEEIESVKGDATVEHLDKTNQELGTVCKAEYAISVLGIKTE